MACIYLCFFQSPQCNFHLLLLLSGDIEPNPGPVISKSCPICNVQIHIRKHVCTCGYVFNQKHRKPPLHVVDYTKGVDVMVTGSVGEGIVLSESAETTKTIEKRARKTCEESTEAIEQSEDSTSIKRASEEGSQDSEEGTEAIKTSEESTEAIESSEDSTEVKRAGENGSKASQNSEEGTEATNTGEESAEPTKTGEERTVVKDESEEQGKPTTLKGVTENGAIPKNDVDNTTVKRYVNMGSLSQPSKWEECSAAINAKRRKLYKLNSMQKRLSNQQYYHTKQDIHSQQVLNSYYNASTPVKEAAKQRARAAYATNPSPIRQKGRERGRDA